MIYYIFSNMCLINSLQLDYRVLCEEDSLIKKKIIIDNWNCQFCELFIGGVKIEIIR